MAKQIRHDWRAEAMAPPGAGKSSKGPLFVAMLLAGILGGAIVGLWFWMGSDPGPRFISIPLYDLNNDVWPPVPYAMADAHRLEQHFDESAREVAATSREEVRYAEILKSLAARGDRPLVLHVTGLAVANGDIVYLLGARANPGEINGSWHPIEELLDAVRKCPAKNKLLILDVTRPVADPSCGVLAERASALLQSQLDKVKDDSSLAVLVSAGAGETSQVFDEEGATAFAYFIDQGLAGAAEGMADSTHDGRIRVSELGRYVQDRVKRWSYFARGARQTPYLVGRADFRLTVPARRYERSESKPPDIKYPPWLTEAWKLREDWCAAGGRVSAPDIVRRLENGLIKAEMRLAAGVPTDKVKGEVGDLRASMERSWQKFSAVTPPPPCSLVSVIRPPGLAAEMEGWLEFKAPDTGRPVPGKFNEVAMKREPKPSRGQILAVVWDKFRNVPLTRQQIPALVNEALLPGEELKQSEATLLRLAAALASTKIFDREHGGRRDWTSPATTTAGGPSVYPADALLAACKSEHEYREAVGVVSPEGFLWFRKGLSDIADQQIAAEKNLASLGDDNLPRALTVAQETTSQFKTAATQAISIHDDAKIASEAFRTLADAAGELPGYGQFLLRLDHTGVGDAMEQWSRASDSAVLLADAFDSVGPNVRDNTASVPTELLRDQAAQLRQSMAGLRQFVDMLDEKKGEPEFEISMALLSSPCLPADRRAKCWERWRKHCADKSWLHEDLANQLAVSSSASQFDAEGEAKRAARRARIGMDLIRLAGVPTGKLNEACQNLQHGTDPAAWDSIGAELVPLYTRCSEPGPGAARAGRVFGTSDAGARAAARLRANLWSWLAERYDAEKTSVRGAVTGGHLFYQRAEDDCKSAAAKARDVSANP
ncbi:MAG: caspase domain-containing protein [Gemmataceae bacterium]